MMWMCHIVQVFIREGVNALTCSPPPPPISFLGMIVFSFSYFFPPLLLCFLFTLLSPLYLFLSSFLHCPSPSSSLNFPLLLSLLFPTQLSLSLSLSSPFFTFSLPYPIPSHTHCPPLTPLPLTSSHSSLLPFHHNPISRTMHRWNSSLVIKRVFFECFDCFMPLFYIAFYQLDVVTLRAEIASLFMSKSLYYASTNENLSVSNSSCCNILFPSSLSFLSLSLSLSLPLSPSPSLTLPVPPSPPPLSLLPPPPSTSLSPPSLSPIPSLPPSHPSRLLLP